MSMMLMVKAMQMKVGNPLRKLVLLKLADNANDKGECWPSYQHIADQCEISRDTAMRHINALEKQGVLRIEKRKVNGTFINHSNIYYLNLGSSTERPRSSTERPRTSHSFEPVNEPYIAQSAKKNEQKKNFNPREYLISRGVSEQTASDFIQHRNKVKAIITKRVVDTFASQAAIANISLEEAIETSILQGWRGFEASWYEKLKGGNHATNQSNHADNSAYGIAKRQSDASYQAMLDEEAERCN